ncbi:MAG: protein phosphatase 2C domain-containing protein [Haliea sp.]|nr:protein phosphatase 2C domain-containing protein [Haliea sp.]
MDRDQVRNVITELFSSNGELSRYREEYSAPVVDEFCNQNASYLADRLIDLLKKHFELRVRAPEAAAGQALDASDLKIQGPISEAIVISDKQQSSDALNELVSAGEMAPVDSQISISDSKVSSIQMLPEVEPKAVSLPPPAQKTGDAMPRKFSFRLKGGKLQVGVPFDGRIEALDGAPNSVAHIISVKIPPELGLVADESDAANLIGTPKVSGDVTIGFDYMIDPEGVIRAPLTSSVSVFINHNPKSLWKNLDSDQSDPHWKPDSDADVLQLSDRTIVAVSKRGRSHAHEGKFREDDFRIVRSETSGWIIVAVADGAGSAAKSRLGSKIAVNTAVDVLLEKLNGPDGQILEEFVASWQRGEASEESVVSVGLYAVLGIAVFEACKALEAEASICGVPAKELSTTLLITAYKPTDFGHVFATYWVGDGGVGVYLKNGDVRLLGKVDSGEFAGQTRFLDYKVMTTEEIASRLRFTVVEDFKALIAMTDGITDPYFTTDHNLECGAYWDKLWGEIAPPLGTEKPEVALLAWLDFWSAGNHDDRTIAVLW